MSKYEFSVEVEPEALPQQTDPAKSVYAFAYTVTVRNTGSVTAQLIARHWHICDAQGHTEEVKGLGVVGHQPLLKPGEAFQYSSGCRLRTPTGSMHGSFFCVAEDGARFEAPVPMFVLQAQGAEPRVLH